jgi:hypothetical protein
VFLKTSVCRNHCSVRIPLEAVDFRHHKISLMFMLNSVGVKLQPYLKPLLVVVGNETLFCIFCKVISLFALCSRCRLCDKFSIIYEAWNCG